MNPVEITSGSSPVILGFPHTGTFVPEDIWSRLNDEGRKLRDTDWHIHTLYEGLLPQASTVRATFHRYVIDANRDPSGTSLYPGQNTTGLVPLTDFDNRPIWMEGCEPDAAETSRRLELFHRPYHAALETEIERVKTRHGIAVIYDCHSIRSRCPFLFDGQLPDLNIGTDAGGTCAPALQAAVETLAETAEGYSHVVNGRFRGGWTTRNYGRPAEGVHTIQMEIAQSAYLETEVPPFAYDGDKAAALRLHLRAILERIEAIARGMAAAAGDRK